MSGCCPAESDKVSSVKAIRILAALVATPMLLGLLGACGSSSPGDVSCAHFMKMSRAQQRTVFRAYVVTANENPKAVDEPSFLPFARSMCREEVADGFGESEKLSDWPGWM